MSKVYLFLADGFEEVEALTPVDLLRRAEIEVQMVSVTGKKTVTGSHGICVCADLLMEEIKDQADMLVLPGGMPGTKSLGECEALICLLKDYDKNGKRLAAICAAPSVLGKNGFLRGKKATCFPGWEEALEGAELVKDDVVTDGRITTSRGMGTAFVFGLELVSLLAGEETSMKIAKGTQFLK